MFKRRIKIKQISACTSEQFFFTVGLGRGGKVYLWNKQLNAWEPHVAPAEPQNG